MRVWFMDLHLYKVVLFLLPHWSYFTNVVFTPQNDRFHKLFHTQKTLYTWHENLINLFISRDVILIVSMYNRALPLLFLVLWLMPLGCPSVQPCQASGRIWWFVDHFLNPLVVYAVQGLVFTWWFLLFLLFHVGFLLPETFTQQIKQTKLILNKQDEFELFSTVCSCFLLSRSGSVRPKYKKTWEARRTIKKALLKNS